MAYFAQAGGHSAFTPQGGGPDQGAAKAQAYQPYQYQAYEPPQADAVVYDDGYGQQPAAGDLPLRHSRSERAAKLLGMLGAVASLALIAGVGVWSYQLISRDVSGIPVVRAVEGPMRIQPQNPGGRPADHQGLAVNAVAANGSAEAPAERLVLAPDAVALTQDDQPLADLSGVETLTAPMPQDKPVLQDDAAQAGTLVSDDSIGAFQQGQIDALVAELTEGAAPLSGGAQPVHLASASPAAVAAAIPAIVQPEPLKPVDASAPLAVASDPALLNAPGVTRSLRPVPRPARFAPAAASAQAGSGPAVLEVDAGSLPAGTRLAQLGAYESAEVARAEWDRIYGKFGDYLDGKKRVIQKAESGGRTFYRLRAMGFTDLADARRFCSALVAGRADCIPVTTR